METSRVVDGKLAVLKAGGYHYDIDRQLYINRASKKAFSVAFLNDESEEKIARLIKEDAPNSAWRFFFVDGPSTAVQEQLANMLG